MSTFTYPGVYIEELSSGVHTITGVATSIAAFVGWAPMGPTTEATMVESWAEYQALFGGLDARSLLGYAVNQFFANGGQQAYIVRLVWNTLLTAGPGTYPVPAATAVASGVGSAATEITASVGTIASLPVTLSVGAPVLESITITPASLPPVPFGTSVTFTAMGNYSDGSQSALAAASWESSNESVMQFTSGSTAQAQSAAGAATITAQWGELSGSVTVNVTPVALSSISITPGSVTLPAGPGVPASGPPQGPTLQLAATAHYADATTPDLTTMADWSLSPAPTKNTDTSLTAGGLLIAGAAGAATVTAAVPGIASMSATAGVTINAAAVLSVAAQQTAPVLTTGQTMPLSAVANNSDGTTTTGLTGTWTSSNTAVATIAGSSVTSVAAGISTLTFTCTLGGQTYTASTTLTVTGATLNAITITPVNPSVGLQLTLPLKATGFYSDGTSADLTTIAEWSSAGGDASVDPNTGVVTGQTVDPSVQVSTTAAWLAVSAKTNVAVTAAVLQSIAVTPAGPLMVLPGQTQQFAATGTYSDGSTQTITTTAKWNSSAPTAASINPATGLATAQAAGGSLTLFAKNPGAWGNTLSVSITASPTAGRFGLLVQQTLSGGTVKTLESYTGLSVTSTDAYYAVTVIDNDSNYVTFINPETGTAVAPAATPSTTSAPVALSGGADGSVLTPATDGNFEIAMLSDATKGVYLLDRVDIFNLLCIPAETDGPTIATIEHYCATKRAFYLVDSWQLSTTAALQSSGPVGSTAGSITGQYATNAAFYFPWVEAPDPLAGNRPTLFPPCGFVAGIYAATDASRGVWKAPAGIDASLTGVTGLQYTLTDLENGQLNIQAINCLREFKVYGDVVWGARTLQGNDQAGSEWKYVPIRRLALFIESSLYNGTQWVVFEPNDETLWGQIRLNVGAFMQQLFLQGAFQGTSPQQAYFVKCDGENNPQTSIDQGIVNILVGFAPLYPAEFVVIQIQQMAGQSSS